MNSFDPVQMRQGTALAIRNRHQWVIWIVAMQRAKVTDVLTPMHCCQRLLDPVAEKREMDTLQVEMQDIELMRPVSNLCEHRKVGRNIPRQVAIEPQGNVSARNQFCSGFAIPTCKQNDLVTSPHEFVG